MHRADVFETLWGKGFFEVLFTDTVKTMSGELLPPLTDEKPVLVEGFRGDSVFFDINTQETGRLFLKLYEPEAVTFSQDGKGFLPGIEVVQIQGGDLRGPGS